MDSEFYVDMFSVAEFIQLKKFADSVYWEWLERQGKEEPEVLQDLPEPGAIYIRDRLKPWVVAGDEQAIWAFNNFDYAAAWNFVLSGIKRKDASGQVSRHEMETWFAYDREIQSLGWNRPVQIILAPLSNGEKRD